MNAQRDIPTKTEDAGTAESAVAPERAPTPAVELVGRTRQAEARLAVATAAGLIEAGISPSDVVITTADIDRYEDALDRAATRYGRTTAVWTPLNLKRTVPYQLVATTLTLLADREHGSVDVETLAEPLTLGWVPVVDGSGPLAPAAVREVVRAHAGVEQSIDGWTATIAVADIERPTKQHWMAYLNWIAAQPTSPTSKDVTETLAPVLEGYDVAVLPTEPRDEAVSELAETLRGFGRTSEIVTMVRQRYARWLAASRTDRQWAVVRDLLESFATTVPGRRELPTAAVIDVMEANDLWARSVPYVIVVGLVDGEWPGAPDSTVPSAARTLIADADDPPIDGVRPHAAWTTARDRDHFASARETVTEAFIVTRHATDTDGVETRPSRFLDEIRTERTDPAAQHALMADPATLPKPIATRVSSGVIND